MYNILSLVLGVVGFGFCFLYDINSYTIQNRLLSGGFFIGSLFIAAATVIELWHTKKLGGFSGALDIILLIFALLAFICLIYSLFFALPFKETYISQAGDVQVCDKGAYALCRHPGVICFFIFYLFLGLAALPTVFWKNCIVFSFINLLYAWFQDRVTFQKIFDDYADYCERVPFIIPNLQSIQNTGKTWKTVNKKEGKK